MARSVARSVHRIAAIFAQEVGDKVVNWSACLAGRCCRLVGMPRGGIPCLTTTSQSIFRTYSLPLPKPLAVFRRQSNADRRW